MPPSFTQQGVAERLVEVPSCKGTQLCEGAGGAAPGPKEASAVNNGQSFPGRSRLSALLCFALLCCVFIDRAALFCGKPSFHTRFPAPVPSLLLQPALEQQRPGWKGCCGGIGAFGVRRKSNRKIWGAAAESQRIEAARPLYRLQYRVPSKSSARDLPQ